MMIALCMSYWANYLGDEEGEGEISLFHNTTG